MLCTNGGLELKFPLDMDDDDVPRIRLFSMAGRAVRSLKVNAFVNIPDINGEVSTTVDSVMPFNGRNHCLQPTIFTICPSHITLSFCKETDY